MVPPIHLGAWSMALMLWLPFELLLLLIPPTMMLAELEDGLLLLTVQVYSPPVVTVRVCVHCAVTGSSNTVSVPSVTVLVQVTVVAGPPVEIQVRVT